MMLHTHLTFNGNCRQAMTFYQKCLGGVLRFQTVGDSPLSKEMSAKMKKSILQGTLRRGKMILVGTDLVSEMGLIKGNSVSILLHCANEREAKSLYKRLSRGGNQAQPLEVNHFGMLMGGLTDRYGYQWIVQCSKV
jgi:PhnB protein